MFYKLIFNVLTALRMKSMPDSELLKLLLNHSYLTELSSFAWYLQSQILFFLLHLFWSQILYLKKKYKFIKPIHMIEWKKTRIEFEKDIEKSFWIPESIGNFGEYSTFLKDDCTAIHFADGFLFLLDFSLESYFAITKLVPWYIQQLFFFSSSTFCNWKIIVYQCKSLGNLLKKFEFLLIRVPFTLHSTQNSANFKHYIYVINLTVPR